MFAINPMFLLKQASQSEYFSPFLLTFRDMWHVAWAPHFVHVFRRRIFIDEGREQAWGHLLPRAWEISSG